MPTKKYAYDVQLYGTKCNMHDLKCGLKICQKFAKNQGFVFIHKYLDNEKMQGTVYRP